MMRRSIIGLICLLMMVLPTVAQEFRATVNGRVTDSAEEAIVSATVTVRNLATNEVAAVTTNGEGAYKSRTSDSLSESFSPGPRQITRSTLQPSALTDPDVVEAARIENRLRHSAAEGGYLILTVDPSQLDRAAQELSNRFELDQCDLDDLFLEHLRAEAERLGASWDVVLAADAAPPGSGDWTNLQRLVDRILPAVETRLRSTRKTCLATHPGLLARYGHMNLIAGLAADVGRDGGPRGLWVLSPDNGQHTLPTLNGTPIPLTNAAQHTRLTPAWLRNEHRATGRDN